MEALWIVSTAIAVTAIQKKKTENPVPRSGRLPAGRAGKMIILVHALRAWSAR